MSNSTITFDAIVQSQSFKERTANAFFDAASPATLYGRRESLSVGLTWAYYGGNVRVNGAISQIANGTIALTASVTNYIEANPVDGSLSKNTTGFTAGRWPLYSIVAGATTVTSYTDYRMAAPPITGLLQKAFPSDANYTATQAEAANDIIQISSGTITATRNFVLPLVPKQWTVFNGNAQSVQFIGATGTGITVATGKRAIIYADGTNIVRVTADV